MASKRPPATTLHPPYQPPATALLIYPATLLLGSLFSVLSPTAQHQHERPPDHAEPPGPAVNYFARKNNIFNAYFVKIGWFWTTIAFATLVSSSTSTSSSGPTPHTRNRKLAQSLLRYLLATLSWFLTTQWFFGPGLLDRGFVLTGGRCERAARHVHGEGEGGGRIVLEDLFSGHACKAAGGRWSGGHDVSGHVFMLVLATAVLVFEGLGVGLLDRGKDKDGDEDERDGDGGGQAWASRIVWGVAGLGWWMLFMTAIWFHTWLEKWSGLLIALGAVYAIYILPRSAVSWRNVVGVPGV